MIFAADSFLLSLRVFLDFFSAIHLIENISYVNLIDFFQMNKTISIFSFQSTAKDAFYMWKMFYRKRTLINRDMLI